MTSNSKTLQNVIQKMNRTTLIKPVGMSHEKLKLYLNKCVHLSMYIHTLCPGSKQAIWCYNTKLYSRILS